MFGGIFGQFSVCFSNIRKLQMGFCALVLIIADAKHSAMNILLFCNQKNLLKGFPSDIAFLNVDRYQGKKQTLYDLWAGMTGHSEKHS